MSTAVRTLAGMYEHYSIGTTPECTWSQLRLPSSSGMCASTAAIQLYSVQVSEILYKDSIELALHMAYLVQTSAPQVVPLDH